MIYVLTLSLVALCAFLQWRNARQLEELLNAQGQERTEWAAERRDLNNRIQVPEAAPFMDTSEAPTQQHVTFDDDEAFHQAMEEMTPDSVREALE